MDDPLSKIFDVLGYKASSQLRGCILTSAFIGIFIVIDFLSDL